MNKSVRSLFAVALSVLLILTLTGCAKQQAAQPPAGSQGNQSQSQSRQNTPDTSANALKPGDFFPLTEGSGWEYQGEGNEYATFTRKVAYVSGDLAQTQEDNGGTISATVYKFTDKAVTAVYFTGENSNGGNLLQNAPNENVAIIEEPLQVGAKWDIPNGTREIIDTNAGVVTPAGTFSGCLKIKINGSDNSTIYEYFQKGTGMVKREFVSGGDTISSSLSKYSK